MADFSHIQNIAHAPSREALKEIARRIAAAETVNPSQVTPTTLKAPLNANGQTISNTAPAQQAQDLITLADAQTYINQRVFDLWAGLGIPTPADALRPPPAPTGPIPVSPNYLLAETGEVLIAEDGTLFLAETP